MTIDDGWQAMSTGNGGAIGAPWDRGNAAFPDMPGLASAIRERGARPGIWIRPLAVADGTASNLLLDPRRWASDERELILDPTIPDNAQRIEADIRRMREWGYELIKHDFTSYDIFGRWGFAMGDEFTNAGWHFADQSKTNAEIVLDLYGAIRRGAGDSLVIGCNTFGHLAAGLVELQRTGDDTSGRDWERTRKMGINTLAFRMPQHDAFFAVDADCVGLTNAVPWELNRQWLDLLSRSGTPLFVSADHAAMGSEQRAAVKSAFREASVARPVAEPLDWTETLCPQEWSIGGETVRYEWTPVADGVTQR
jgi:alpha-galactosidase